MKDLIGTVFLELDPVGETIDAWIETLTEFKKTHPAYRFIKLQIEDDWVHNESGDDICNAVVSVKAETE